MHVMRMSMCSEHASEHAMAKTLDVGHANISIIETLVRIQAARV